MQLKNRLKKLETNLIVEGEFCNCPDTRTYEVVLRNSGVDTIENPIADFCSNCRKPVNKTTIIVNFVKTKQPDWMSDEQYAAAYRD